MLLCGLERVMKQVMGTGKARVGFVHRGGGDAGEPRRTRLTHDLAGEWVRIVGLLRAFRAGGEIDQNAATLDFHRVGGDRVLFEAGLAETRAAMEFPVVPRAVDVIAVEAAFAERSADVVASVGDDAEFAVLERHGKLAGLGGYLRNRILRKLLARPDIDPLLGHQSLPIFSQNIRGKIAVPRVRANPANM